MKLRPALACPALALVLLAAPAAALAEGTAEGVATEEAADAVVDRADFYEPAEDDPGAASPLAAGLALVQVSDEMKYFTKYESHGNYDQGFSAGDGYNALGYYQLDRRYGLMPFLSYCLSYDAEKYAMFETVVARASEVQDSSVAMCESGVLTELGSLVEGAWHQAYAADPEEFSLLQDNYAYNSYYAVTESYLAQIGISMEGRADCVKGLVWSMTNLFGTGGVRWFIGEARLGDELTDRQLVNRLCDAVVDNVAERYPSQPQYHEGWIARYESERADCLGMLAGAAPRFTDVAEGAWFADDVTWAADRGYMNGYADGTGRFGPAEALSRAQMVTLLWNYDGMPATAVSALPSDCDGDAFYARPLSWALSAGYVSGYESGDFGPVDALTREQAVLILWRYLGRPSSDADLSAYPDAESVSSWAREAMAWAVSEGVITGKDGRLAPQGTCSRAELAAILRRL